MSQLSISLALAALGDRICKIGAARSTRYVATKAILGLPAKQPLHLTDDAGLPAIFGELTYLSDGGVYVQSVELANGLSRANTLTLP